MNFQQALRWYKQGIMDAPGSTVERIDTYFKEEYGDQFPEMEELYTREQRDDYATESIDEWIETNHHPLMKEIAELKQALQSKPSPVHESAEDKPWDEKESEMFREMMQVSGIKDHPSCRYIWNFALTWYKSLESHLPKVEPISAREIEEAFYEQKFAPTNVTIAKLEVWLEAIKWYQSKQPKRSAEEIVKPEAILEHYCADVTIGNPNRVITAMKAYASQFQQSAGWSEALQVLEKLVWLKTMKDKWSGVVPLDEAQFNERAEDIRQRKIAEPIAWEKACKIVAEYKSQNKVK